MLGEKCVAFHLVLFSSHTVSHASHSHAQTVEPLCLRGTGLLIQARRLTDLNWFAQVSQVKVLYTKRSCY